MADCQNMGVEEVEEKVTEDGPYSKCGPIRDPQFMVSCPAYTVTVPFHHRILKKEGYTLKESATHLDVIKRKMKCKISSGTVEEGPSRGETYYVGECVADGPPQKVRQITDPQDELC